MAKEPIDENDITLLKVEVTAWDPKLVTNEQIFESMVNRHIEEPHRQGHRTRSAG